MSNVNDEIQQLLMQLDMTKLKDLDKAQIDKLRDNIIDVRNTANPYSSTVREKDKNLLLLMFTPMAKDYMIKLLTTSMIAYLFRANDERDVPDGVPVVSVYDYIRDQSLLDDPRPVDDKIPVSVDMLEDYALARRLMAGKMEVARFLESLFQYNPDVHVRSSYSPNGKDPERTPVVTASSKLAVYMRKKELEKEKTKMTRLKQEQINVAEEKKQLIAAAPESMEKTEVKEVICKLRSKDGSGFKLVKRRVRCTKKDYDEYMAAKEKRWVSAKEEKAVTKYQDDMVSSDAERVVALHRCKDVTLQDTVRNILPPADFFHRFGYYMESNYEELLAATQDIYADKPDMDYAINPIRFVKDENDARKYRRKVEGEINWPILSVEQGNWSLLGPYKKNRDRLDFYGSNMQLFEEMFKQKETDRDIGAKLMKNKKRRKRRENRKKEGPIPAGVEKAGKILGTLDKYKSPNDKDKDENSDDELSDGEENVRVKVVRMSRGGRTTEVTEFDTSYDFSHVRTG